MIRIIYNSIFLALLLILIIITKPRFMFDEEGNLKEFGVKQNQTPFSLGVVVVILSLVSFYTFTLIDLFFGN